ncbi:MAG: TonB-dependent receptor [Ignavibacteriales bacterium]|nr:TonB-dependent receptor [Ignavibacteriales bacterium]
MTKLFLMIILVLSFTFQANAQTENHGTLSGYVYDSSNGEGLIGASVYLKDLNVGATTNLSGYFVIPNTPTGNQTLVISYIGYKTQLKNLFVSIDENEILKFKLDPSAVQTKEVVITGDSIRTIEKLFVKPISKIELNAKQINSIPRVIEADLLRSLQTLPGIQPLSDFSSALYVRGGTPDQNLYQIDGTDVYNPEHAFGLFSTFNTNAIKKIELSKGGFNAEYGGRLSSILSVTNLDGNRNNIQGDVSISLLSGATTLQAPLGNFGSISGSFRRTYLDQTLAKFIDEIPPYYFYDGNIKTFLDLGEKDKLVLSFYGGKDNLDYKFDTKASESLGFHYDWGNTTGSINWKRIITPKLFANFWITASRFTSLFTYDEANLEEYNKISDYSVKGNMEYYYSKHFIIKFGFEEKNLHGVLYENFQGGKVDANKYRNHYTGYVTTNWRPSDNFDIEGGLRYDYFRTDKHYQNLDPRFAIKYRLTETSNLKFSSGIYHQYLNRVPRMFFASLWTSADQYTSGSKSYHFILGYQKEINQIYELEVEAYYKKYKDIYSFNQTMLTEISADYYTGDNLPVYTETKGMFNRGDGESYGIEVLLRKDYGAITGWLGYSLAKTKYIFDDLNHGKSFSPRHDRTSTVNVVANVDIKQFFDELKGISGVERTSNWLLGINFIYATGQPMTIPTSAYAVNKLPDWNDNSNGLSLYPSELNTLRLPPYIRMDIIVTYEKHYNGWTLAPYLQIFNVGNRKNVWFINYDNEIKDNIFTQKIETINMFPMLPSIGVNIKF